MERKLSFDYWLIIATVVVLFVISLICIYGMLYFKFAEIHQLAAADKTVYMEKMNAAIGPFLVALILLLGICIPKRLLPKKALFPFVVILVGAAVVVFAIWGVKKGLLVVLLIGLFLQSIVLLMALFGAKRLHFHKTGYFMRLGSALVHLGLILFVLDLFLYEQKTWHLALFWTTTGAWVLGMLGCFYAEGIVRLLRLDKTPRG